MKTKRISLTKFIEDNKSDIIDFITTVCPNCTDFSDKNIREWIQNNETLYNWAVSEGVKNP